MNQDLLAQAKSRLPLSGLMAQLGFGEFMARLPIEQQRPFEMGIVH